MDLTHISLSTGAASRSRRDAVPDAVADHLLPVVADGVGPLPLFEGWFLDVRVLPPADADGTSGGAYIQLGEEPPPSRTPAVMAVACWSGADEAACWQLADGAYRALRAELAALGRWRAPPRRMPPVPWIATWLTPHAASADPAVLQALTPMECAVAWVLIGRSPVR